MHISYKILKVALSQIPARNLTQRIAALYLKASIEKHLDVFVRFQFLLGVLQGFDVFSSSETNMLMRKFGGNPAFGLRKLESYFKDFSVNPKFFSLENTKVYSTILRKTQSLLENHPSLSIEDLLQNMISGIDMQGNSRTKVFEEAGKKMFRNVIFGKASPNHLIELISKWVRSAALTALRTEKRQKGDSPLILDKSPRSDDDNFQRYELPSKPKDVLKLLLDSFWDPKIGPELKKFFLQILNKLSGRFKSQARIGKYWVQAVFEDKRIPKGKEIAQFFEISPSTVSIILKKIIMTFRDALQNDSRMSSLLESYLRSKK